MKVLISVDMEGICGVTSWVQVMPPEVEGAREAVGRARDAAPWRLAPDSRAEIDFDHQARAQACLFVPGV